MTQNNKKTARSINHLEMRLQEVLDDLRSCNTHSQMTLLYVDTHWTTQQWQCLYTLFLKMVTLFMCSVYRVLNPLPSLDDSAERKDSQFCFVSLFLFLHRPVACGLPGVTPKPPPNNTATGRSTQSHAHSHSQCDRKTKCCVSAAYREL